MKNEKELKKWAEKQARLVAKVENALVFLESKHALLGKILRATIRFLVWDYVHDVSGRIFGLIGLGMIGLSLIGIEGWTTGSEIKLFSGGVLLVCMEAWFGYRRYKFLLDLYRIGHGGITEWKRMVFDIRESFLDTIHRTLQNEFPGIEIFGRYATRTGNDKETERTRFGFDRQWENRPRKRLKAVCFVWKNGDKEVRLEYRRQPGNLYASRFLQTLELDKERHDKLRILVDDEEWSCQPRFPWICKLGVFKFVIISSIIVSLMLWGGIESAQHMLAENTGNSNIISRARGGLVKGALAFVFALTAIGIRGYYFPAGVFRIDEEKNTQQEKDKIQARGVKWIAWSLVAAVLAGLTPKVVDVCNSGIVKKDQSKWTTFGVDIENSNICRLIRYYHPKTKTIDSVTPVTD